MRRRAKRLALGAAILALAACSDGQPPHVAASGVNGSEGGAEQTLYYDSTGHPHFL